MAEPSFLYCGLDAETRALAQELETLGGGDAKLDTMDVHAIIDDRLVKGDMQVLWAHNKTVGLRNALLPRSQPEADTMSYTTVTSTQRLSDMLRAPIPLVDDVARWTLNGFNACVIAYGARGVGKTLSLFGPAPPSPSSSQSSYPTSLPTCYTASLLQQLFAEAEHMAHSQSGSMTIGISAWVLRGSSIVDLGTPSTAAASLLPLEFAAIECPDYETASRIVATCRMRAPGVLTHAPDRPQAPEAQRGHFFLRIIVHRDSSPSSSSAALRMEAALPPPSSSLPAASLRGSLESIVGQSLEGLGGLGSRAGTLLTHIHLVDLVGTSGGAPPSSSSSGAGSSVREWRERERAGGSGGTQDQHVHMSEADKIAKRETMLQLQTFGRLLGEIATLAEAAEVSGADHRDFPVPKRTCARESKLTSILAPIMQGNCKTFLMAYLRDGEDHYKRSRPVLSLLQGLSGVSVPCHRVTGVSVHDLGLVSPYTVLAPYIVSSRAAAVGDAGSGLGRAASKGRYSDDAEEDEDEGLDLLAVAAGNWASSSSSSSSTAAAGSGAGSGSRAVSAGQRVDRAIGSFKAMLADVASQPPFVLPQPQPQPQPQQRQSSATAKSHAPPFYPPVPAVPAPAPAPVPTPTPAPAPAPAKKATPSHREGSALSVDEPHEDDRKAALALEARNVYSVLDSLTRLRQDPEAALAISTSSPVSPLSPTSSVSISTPLKPAVSPPRGLPSPSSASRGPRGVSWASPPGSARSPYVGEEGEEEENLSSDSIATAAQVQPQPQPQTFGGAGGAGMQTTTTTYQHQQQVPTFADSPASVGAAAFFGLGRADEAPSPSASGPPLPPLSSVPEQWLPQHANAMMHESAQGGGMRGKPVAQIADEFAALLDRDGSPGHGWGGDDESKYDNGDALNASWGSATSIGSLISHGQGQQQLRRNIATLLEALSEERRGRVASERALSLAREEALEAATRYEVQADDLRLEERRLRGQLRAVMNSASMQDVALLYEEHVARLCNELESLRRRNLVLEERELAQLEPPPRPYATGMQSVRRSSSAVLGMGAALATDPTSSSGLLGLRASYPPPKAFSSASAAAAAADGPDAAMDEAERALFQASLRGAHASSRLRRLAQENLALQATIEQLRRGERHAQLQERMHEQTQKKLRTAHAEAAKLSLRLKEVSEALFSRQRDLSALTTEHSLVAASERSLKAERARTLAELGLYRERVREMDIERRKMFKAAQEHGPLADRAFAAAAASAGLTLSVGTGALAGPAIAPYVRQEELHSGSESLEDTLAQLHEELLHAAPTTLPLLRRLGEEVHDERVRFLAVQSKLLAAAAQQQQQQQQPLPHQQHQQQHQQQYEQYQQYQQYQQAANPLAAKVRGMVDPAQVPGIIRAASGGSRRRVSFRGRAATEGEEPKPFIF